MSEENENTSIRPDDKPTETTLQHTFWFLFHLNSLPGVVIFSISITEFSQLYSLGPCAEVSFRQASQYSPVSPPAV